MTPHEDRIAKAAFRAYVPEEELDWEGAPESERAEWLRVAQAAIRAHETEPTDACHFPPDEGKTETERNQNHE